MRNATVIIRLFLFLFAAVLLESCAAKKGLKKSEILKYDEATFDYFYAEGMKQKLLGNVSEALKYLVNCERLNPENDAVHYQIAQILLSAGDLKNGKQYTQRAYSLDTTNIWYSDLLARVYYEERRIDSSIYVYEKALMLRPDDESLQMSLANFYSEVGDYEKAIKLHETFQQKYGINDNTTPAYIQNLIFTGKLELALEMVQEAIILLPEEVKFYAQLADIYERKGERQKAEQVYRHLLSENPKNLQILIAVYDFWLSEGKYDEMFQVLNAVIIGDEASKEEKISFFTKIIEVENLPDEAFKQTILALMVFEAVYKNDAIIVLLRSELLEKNNRKNEAIEWLEMVISRQPDNYFAWEKVLLLYFQTKDFKNLMARGEECASRFNRSILAKLLYAHGALENQKFDVALEELRKASILAGDNNEALMQIVSMRAEVFYRMGNFDETFKTFEEALKINPDDMTILNNYAYYLAEHDLELKRAEVMSRKVIEEERDNATFLDTYAWVLYKRGKVKEAARIMEQVISKGENLSAEHYEHYGFMLQKLKKCAAAIENWRMAIKLDNSKQQLNKEIENCGKK